MNTLIEPHIIAETPEYRAFCKPSGWLSIPGRFPLSTDLVFSQWLHQHFPNEDFLLHRLDQFTSGVILTAKNALAQKHGRAWFEHRKVKKTYAFFAAPIPSLPVYKTALPLDEKPAQTRFEIEKKFATYFFGKAYPITGRFHQVRRHAQALGFPLLGDQRYGSDHSAPRVMLHAEQLVCEIGQFNAPLPADFLEMLS